MKPNVARIERLNYLIGAILVAGGALTQPRDIALGLAIGVGLTCINFFVLRRLITKWTSEVARGDRGSNAAFLMLPKMILLMGSVAAVILFLPVDALAFIIGYSTFLVSMTIDTIYGTVFAAPEPDEPFEEDGNQHG